MNVGQHSLLKHTWAAVLTLALGGLGEFPEGRDAQKPEQAPLSIPVEMPLLARKSWSHPKYYTLSLRAALTLSSLADSKKGMPMQTTKILSQTEQEKDKALLINTLTGHALVLSLLRGQIAELLLIQVGFRREAGLVVVHVYP